MLLKKTKISLIYLVGFIVIFFSNYSLANSNDEINKNKLLEYLKNIKSFSSTFLQSNGETIEGGVLYLKNNRLRVEYTYPNKIIIILAKNKAMYFNKDLEEVEYFNPQKSQAEIFFNIFFDKKYLKEAKYTDKNKTAVLTKNINLDEGMLFILRMVFEKNPMLLRKIEVINDEELITYSIQDHDYFPSLNDKLFSMANPLLK